MNFLNKLFRPRVAAGVFVGRRRTRDISYLANSPFGFPGRSTRSVPAPKIVAGVNDSTTPIASFGLFTAPTASNTWRNVQAGDLGAAIQGIAIQAFPFQPSSATNYGAQSIGGLVAVPAGPLDIMRSGFATVYCNSSTAASATLISPVCVWTAASSGTHIQGGCEIAPAATVASAPGANTGNGTVGTLSVTAASASPGAYLVKFTAATTFNVFDPNGRELLPGTTGVAYSDGGVAFTITAGGTAFVAGDSFTVTATFQTATLPNASFAGPGDASGVIEVAFNL